MQVSFGGLASGLDTNALIDGLVAAESFPLQRNQALQADLTSAKGTLSSLLSRMKDLKSAAEALDSDDEVASFAATVTGAGLVATTSGSGLAGSYEIDVTQLAKESRIASDAVADPAADLGMNTTYSITVGGFAAVDVDVTAGDTLADVAAKINNSDARVNASIVYDGSQHRLMIRGNDTGAANQVSISATGDPGLGIENVANRYQDAQDATIVLDGQFSISRATNKFTDVVPGASFTATQVTTSPVTLTVEPDSDAQADKLQALVDAYNSAISAGHLAAGFGSVEATNKNLAGDSAVRTSLDRLARSISTPVSGLTGKYNMLAAIGINLTQGGQLELDRTTLETALSDDPQAVSRVLAGDPANGIDGAMKNLISTVDSVADGSSSVLESRIGVFDTRIERLEEDELDLERRLEDYEARLRSKFTDLEILISQIQQQGNGLAGFVNFSNQTTK